MGAVLEAAKAYLDEIDWTYTEADEVSALEFTFAGTWGVTEAILLERGSDQVAIYVILPLRVPLEEVTRAHVMCGLLNHGLAVTTFETGATGGALRCRGGMAFGNGEPSPQAIGATMRLCLDTADKYLPAFRSVLQDGTAVDEAIEAIRQAHL